MNLKYKSLIVLVLLVGASIGCKETPKTSGSASKLKAWYDEWIRKKKNWKLFDHQPPTKNALQSVIAFSTSDIWCVGDWGTILHFDGESWESFEITDQRLLDIDGTSSSDLWVVGYKNTILHYDGFDWADMNTGINAATGNFRSVGTSDDDETIVGGLLSKSLLRALVEGNGEKGVAYRLTVHGWEEIILPDDVTMVTDVEILESDNFLLATRPNSVIRYRNNNFEEHSLSISPYKLWVSSSEKFWVIAHFWNIGSLYRYSNSTFAKEREVELGLASFKIDFPLTGIHGVDEDEIWAVGPRTTIYHYSCGIWRKEEYAGNYGILQFLNTKDYFLWDVFALDKRHVYAVGEQGILLEYVR